MAFLIGALIAVAMIVMGYMARQVALSIVGLMASYIIIGGGVAGLFLVVVVWALEAFR